MERVIPRMKYGMYWRSIPIRYPIIFQENSMRMNKRGSGMKPDDMGTCDNCGNGFSIKPPDYEDIEKLIIAYPDNSFAGPIRTHWHCPFCNFEVVY